MRNILILLKLLTSFSNFSHAGELRLGQSGFCDWTFSGVIEKGDSIKIGKIPLMFNGGGRRLCLNSPGGSLSEGLKIFDLIWDVNITTAVIRAWVKEQDVLQNRSVNGIYLYPFDMKITDLPKNSEHMLAIDPPPTKYDDWDDEPWSRMINFSGKDLPGGDIGSISDQDFAQCAEACVNNSLCIAATHDRWNERCFLKGADALVGKFTLQPKTDTYVRPSVAFWLKDDPRPAPIKHRTGKGFDDSGYETVAADTFESCAAYCLDDDTCLAVNYHASKNSCKKFSYPYKYFTMKGIEIGLKVQID